MNFYELIKTNNWLSVSMTLTNLYPDQLKSIEMYESVFESIQRMTITESDIQIVLQQCNDEENNEESYVDVSGSKKNSNFESTENLAIEFVPWTEWLGMAVGQETMIEFSELEIVSHCLYEMTFVGFDEEEIQKQFSSINKTVDDCKNMTEDEKQKRSKS